MIVPSIAKALNRLVSVVVETKGGRAFVGTPQGQDGQALYIRHFGQHMAARVPWSSIETLHISFGSES